MKEIVIELIWPVFIWTLIYFYRDKFSEFLDLLKERVKAGSPLNVGPGGISLGAIPKLPDNPSPEDKIDDEFENVSESKATKGAIGNKVVKPDLRDSITLVHTTSFWKIKNNRPYYRVFVNLDSSFEDALDSVEKVVYTLHPTFKNPVREINSRNDNFLLKTNCWGEFIIKASVYFKEASEVLKIERYIDIKP